MKLKRLLKGISAQIDSALSEIDIEAVSIDSRNMPKKGLFVAIKGSRLDGHEFIGEAFKKGARAALAESNSADLRNYKNVIRVKNTKETLPLISNNFYDSPSAKLKVIGITGTNGKTTTSLLMESILNASGAICGVIGTINYKTGKSAIPAGRTTPDALTINALLDRMVRNKLKAAVMEVSSHALDQGRVSGVSFDAAVFTNLTHEHLDYHATLEDYFKSKARIFGNLKKKGVAVINADDKYAKRLLKTLKRKKITYGLYEAADVSAEIKNAGMDGSSFIVRIYKKSAFPIKTKLAGLHNVSNILAAIACAFALDIDPDSIKKGIEKVRNVPGRLESVEAGQKFKVFVDYAHTDNALENVLKFLNRIKHGKVITLFGCGGDRDTKKRPLMGRVAQKLSDFIIITSDNPRSEDPKEIARQIERGMDAKKNNYSIILDREKAIENALKKAGKDDIVLIAGKGHEKYQIIGEREIPFDDRKAANTILRGIVNRAGCQPGNRRG